MEKSSLQPNSKVGVLIVNLNRKEELLRCMQSLMDSDYGPLEILIIDNGSTDGAADIISQVYPNTTLLRQSTNLGFTGGNNLGIRYFLARDVEYIFLLNNDAVVDKATISTLVSAAEADPMAGFVGPKVLTIENPDVILSAGAWLVNGWNPVQRGNGEIDQGQYDLSCEMDYLSGCAILVRRQVIQQTGLFDEEFFAYNEDAEWCVRAHRAGFKILYVPQARAWHPDTSKRDEYSVAVAYYIFRNNLLMAKKLRLGWLITASILLRYLRTLFSWTIRPKWKNKRKLRNILLFALRDYCLSRYGKMGADVAQLCFDQ